MFASREKVLIISPHPDDEIFCLRCLGDWRYYCDITVLFISGCSSRIIEAKSAMKFIGWKSIFPRDYNLVFTDGLFHKDARRLSTMLNKFVIDYDSVWSPALEGGHPDHDIDEFAFRVGIEARFSDSLQPAVGMNSRHQIDDLGIGAAPGEGSGELHEIDLVSKNLLVTTPAEFTSCGSPASRDALSRDRDSSEPARLGKCEQTLSDATVDGLDVGTEGSLDQSVLACTGFRKRFPLGTDGVHDVDVGQTLRVECGQLTVQSTGTLQIADHSDQQEDDGKREHQAAAAEQWQETFAHDPPSMSVSDSNSESESESNATSVRSWKSKGTCRRRPPDLSEPFDFNWRSSSATSCARRPSMVARSIKPFSSLWSRGMTICPIGSSSLTLWDNLGIS